MNIQIIAFMGRQPEISLAEITSLVGARAVVTTDNELALVSRSLPTDRMGGVLKVAQVIRKYDSACNLKLIKDSVLDYCQQQPAQGKLTLGLSCYGLPVVANDIGKILKSIKLQLKEVSRSVRIIQAQSTSLSTAQVFHNRLTKEKKIELCVCRINGNTYLARTTWVQDITSYRRRDFDRPKRDSKVGMLPPKLAQTIINLATEGQTGLLLDPFCGTGVILQEGLLMNYSVIGSDISERMLAYTQENLNRLNYQKGQLVALEKADAQTHKWPTGIKFVASETYLGPALKKVLADKQLNQIVVSVNKLHKQFLTNLASQLTSGQRICLAIPAWRTQDGSFRRLPVLDALEAIGYNRLCFTDGVPLVYWRLGQFVGRELLVASKK